MFEEKTANCPGCCKPILNEGQFGTYAKFKMKCPWCQKNLAICIQPKIIARILEPENFNTEKEIKPVAIPRFIPLAIAVSLAGITSLATFITNIFSGGP